MLREFFDNEMDSQLPIAGAVEGINTLAEKADVVILTNLVDGHRDARAQQLAKVGINARVFTNQGPKGPALKAIMDEYAPTRAVFIDDLARFDIRIFADMGQVLKKDDGVFKNMRISFVVDNVFDGRRLVRDSNGDTPIGFQPLLIDPTGRYLGIDIRKLF